MSKKTKRQEEYFQVDAPTKDKGKKITLPKGPVTKEQLNALNPAVVYYINHLHIATAGFIAATGIAVACLCWWGVRKGEWWAWWGALVSPVVGVAVALPMHYFGHFNFNWVSHLGPIYLATLLFVIGSLQVLRGLLQQGVS